MRYVTTERRGISPKVSRPRGLKPRAPIGRVARRSGRAQALLPPRALSLAPRRFNALLLEVKQALVRWKRYRIPSLGGARLRLPPWARAHDGTGNESEDSKAHIIIAHLRRQRAIPLHLFCSKLDQV
jgi:hypothetical protein